MDDGDRSYRLGGLKIVCFDGQLDIKTLQGRAATTPDKRDGSWIMAGMNSGRSPLSGSTEPWTSRRLVPARLPLAFPCRIRLVRGPPSLREMDD
jgi:hypothetical protein